MSTCSAIIARTEKSTFVAHVGMSELVEVEAIAEKFKKEGVDLNKALVIASVNKDGSRTASDKTGIDKRASLEDYYRLGFKKEQVLPFTYDPFPVQDLRRIHEEGSKVVNAHNLKKVIVTPNFVYSYSFNLQRNPSPFPPGYREIVTKPYYDTHVTALTEH